MESTPVLAVKGGRRMRRKKQTEQYNEFESYLDSHRNQTSLGTPANSVVEPSYRNDHEFLLPPARAIDFNNIAGKVVEIHEEDNDDVELPVNKARNGRIGTDVLKEIWQKRYRPNSQQKYFYAEEYDNNAESELPETDNIPKTWRDDDISSEEDNFLAGYHTDRVSRFKTLACWCGTRSFLIRATICIMGATVFIALLASILGAWNVEDHDESSLSTPPTPTFNNNPSAALTISPPAFMLLPPSATPSRAPSSQPTPSPTVSPLPTHFPTQNPTRSVLPSYRPSAIPTTSSIPSATPSESPTQSSIPSKTPSEFPSISVQPSSTPSAFPTVSVQTSQSPSSYPTTSIRPSVSPSATPTNSSRPGQPPTRTPTKRKRHPPKLPV